MAALILIVDDDPVQRRLLESMARRFGYEVETAESGADGLARLEAPDRPATDLIVLVLVRPDLDGVGGPCRQRQTRPPAPRRSPDRRLVDRGRDLGDARRRRRFRGQAGRRR